jgi:hypothetical protein
MVSCPFHSVPKAYAMPLCSLMDLFGVQFGFWRAVSGWMGVSYQGCSVLTNVILDRPKLKQQQVEVEAAKQPRKRSGRRAK